MASQCYSGLVLSVVISLLALEYSSAMCYEGNVGKKGQGGSKTGKDVPLRSNSKFFGGRKMLQGLDEKPVYIPGKGKPADLDHSFPELQTEGDRVQAQNKGESFNQKGDHKSEESIFSNEVDERRHSKKSMASDQHTSKKNDESKEVLEAADEVANLMRRDYKGMNRPRQKPPINNNEPKH